MLFLRSATFPSSGRRVSSSHFSSDSSIQIVYSCLSPQIEIDYYRPERSEQSVEQLSYELNGPGLESP